MNRNKSKNENTDKKFQRNDILFFCSHKGCDCKMAIFDTCLIGMPNSSLYACQAMLLRVSAMVVASINTAMVHCCF